jgi:hypothetical protein
MGWSLARANPARLSGVEEAAEAGSIAAEITLPSTWIRANAAGGGMR